MSNKLLETLLSEEWYGQRLIDALKEKGWTPPPEKPEPEFKPGDYCIFGSNHLSIYKGCVPADDRHMDSNGQSWKECRHAPTWIKWEDGDSPVPSGTKGTVFSTTGRPYIKMYDGRWAWMPE